MVVSKFDKVICYMLIGSNQTIFQELVPYCFTINMRMGLAMNPLFYQKPNVKTKNSSTWNY